VCLDLPHSDLPDEKEKIFNSSEATVLPLAFSIRYVPPSGWLALSQLLPFTEDFQICLKPVFSLELQPCILKA
jgi:hypothetical protein